jgi:hypothetical protein
MGRSGELSDFERGVVIGCQGHCNPPQVAKRRHNHNHNHNEERGSAVRSFVVILKRLLFMSWQWHGRTGVNHKKSVRIADILANIQTGHCPKASHTHVLASALLRLYFSETTIKIGLERSV